MRMTWDEFKAHVDAEIARQGADGSVEVWYIDVVQLPDDTEEIVVTVDDRPGAGLAVST